MTDEPELTYCAYCGEAVVVGEACTDPHYWPAEENEAGEACACCGDAFGSGEFARSRCDASLCHWCYTNGEDDE